MFITGPQVIKQVTGEQITAEALGGADAHMAHSGVIHFVAENDQDALHLCRRLLSFFPSNNLEDPPRLPHENNVNPNPELAKIVPVEPRQGYDMRQVIGGVVDRGDFLEVQSGWAPNIVVGFARILGQSVGGAHLAMCSKDLGADRVLAWPTAEVAVMGAEGAVEIVFRKEVQEAPDKAARRAELIETYRSTFANPYVAAGRRLVDE